MIPANGFRPDLDRALVFATFPRVSFQGPMVYAAFLLILQVEPLR